MPRVSRRALLASSALAPFVGGALALAGSRDKTIAAPSGRREVFRERYFPNVTLTTHQGKKVKFYDDLLRDKIVVINFMYVKCEGVCPGVTANLLQVQKLLGDRVGRDIFMYSITLKPEEDTPAALKKYAEMHKVGPGWLFLTGKPDDIELLRRKLGFVDPDPVVDADKSSHIGNIRYGNERFQLWAATPGLSDPKWLVECISWMDRSKESLIEAQASRAKHFGRKGS